MPWSSIVGDSPRFSWVRPVALLLACALAQSCSQPSQINVAVVFANTWAFEAVDETEEAAVKRLALGTLREAFEGFSVRFRETRSGDRIIRIEDTPYASDPRQMVTFGAAGVTYPASKVSSVRIDVLFNAELAAVHCSHISDCSKSRSELFAGLGRGVGATAAHELGHQAGFGFSRDSSCAECYDGKSSTNDVHFFGVKYWSHEALQNMKGVLPRDAVSGALPE